MNIQNIPDAEARSALSRLLEVASGYAWSSNICGFFILGWWNHHEHKDFRVNYIWRLDPHIAADMRLLINFVAENPGKYPNELVSDEHLIRLAEHMKKFNSDGC